MKTLLELLSEQEEQIRIWVDDNPEATEHEFNVANNCVVTLNFSVEILTPKNDEN
jgi:hypothetical protein